MTFTPKYRYIRVRTDHFGDNTYGSCEPTIFAIDNNVILFSDDFRGSPVDEDAIFKMANTIALAENKELYKKMIDFREYNEYLSFMNDTTDGSNGEEILVYADMYSRPYISCKTDLEWGEDIRYGGGYELLEEDDEYAVPSSNLFKNDNGNEKPEIPAQAIKDQIDYLRSLDEIAAMTIWTEEDIAEAIASNGYADNYANILSIKDEIESLLGRNDAHKNFILETAICRAIRDGALSEY